ncbi:hypothetical protein ABPG72_018973 [Tetrahymena utriculariae]
MEQSGEPKVYQIFTEQQFKDCGVRQLYDDIKRINQCLQQNGIKYRFSPLVFRVDISKVPNNIPKQVIQEQIRIKFMMKALKCKYSVYHDIFLILHEIQQDSLAEDVNQLSKYKFLFKNFMYGDRVFTISFFSNQQYALLALNTQLNAVLYQSEIKQPKQINTQETDQTLFKLQKAQRFSADYTQLQQILKMKFVKVNYITKSQDHSAEQLFNDIDIINQHLKEQKKSYRFSPLVFEVDISQVPKIISEKVIQEQIRNKFMVKAIKCKYSVQHDIFLILHDIDPIECIQLRKYKFSFIKFIYRERVFTVSFFSDQQNILKDLYQQLDDLHLLNTKKSQNLEKQINVKNIDSACAEIKLFTEVEKMKLIWKKRIYQPQLGEEIPRFSYHYGINFLYLLESILNEYW